MAGEALPSTAPVKSFACKNCGAAVTIRAEGTSVTAVCPSCKSISDVTDENYNLVQKALSAQSITPLIELGTKGKLRGEIYQVLGFMRRFEPAYPDQPWEEYLLWNPRLGYKWLVESKGHWNYVTMVKNKPKMMLNEYYYLGESFKIYHTGEAKVAYVIGEFYWQVRIGEHVKTMDAIRPPRMLSLETGDGDQEAVWSVADYITPDEVKAAFNLKSLPAPIGIAPNQPSNHGSPNELWVVWFLAFIGLFGLQMAFATLRPEIKLTGLTGVHAPVNEQPVAQFSIQRRTSHVAITIWSNVDNNWVDVQLRVGPSTTGAKSFEFQKELSYYRGYSDGESWSEGKSSEEFLVNEIPKGDYTLFITAEGPAGLSTPIEIGGEIRESSLIWSNFWLAFFLILIPPGLMSWRGNTIEKRRWEDSENSPFESQDGD